MERECNVQENKPQNRIKTDIWLILILYQPKREIEAVRVICRNSEYRFVSTVNSLSIASDTMI